MGRLAVIGKHGTLGEPDPATTNTVLGGVPVGVVEHPGHVLLYRHGLDEYVPPHRIDHGAHVRALQALDCDRVLAVSSVGSLHLDMPVGTFVAPDDFIALDQPPIVAVDHHGQHVVPGFDPRWRAEVLAAWPADVAHLVDRGVYWQANGPRFETPAEIRFIAAHAAVVGMTVASECVAANQIGIPYAAICIVDNLANGLDATPLTPEEYERGQATNRVKLEQVIGHLIDALTSVP